MSPSSAITTATTTPSAASSSSTNPVVVEPSTTQQRTSPSVMSYAIGVILVATSAGMVLYTRKTGSMLRTLEHNLKPRQPTKAGPPTKEEWERMRPRLDDDDIV